MPSKKLASKGGKKHICSIQHNTEKFMLKALSFEKCENSIFAIRSAEFFHSLFFLKKWINWTFFNYTLGTVSWIRVFWRKLFFLCPLTSNYHFILVTCFDLFLCVYTTHSEMVKDTPYSSLRKFCEFKNISFPPTKMLEK